MTNVLNDPSIPPHDHVAWCRNHTDGGLWDQRCSTAPQKLSPAAAAKNEPMTIAVQADQFLCRADEDPTWTPDAPEIKVSILVPVHDIGMPNYWVHSTLTLAEARKLAAAILNLAELAANETGRCAR